MRPQIDGTGRQSQGHGGRVLVVEDEAAQRALFAEVLTMAGFDVAVAANGREGISLVEQEHFDVIVSDIMMPEVDGLAMLEQVRQLSPDTQVILISAHSTFDIALEGLRRGAAGFIEKPVWNHRIIETVRNAVARRPVA